jgi:hypothetical protein
LAPSRVPAFTPSFAPTSTCIIVPSAFFNSPAFGKGRPAVNKLDPPVHGHESRVMISPRSTAVPSLSTGITRACRASAITQKQAGEGLADSVRLAVDRGDDDLAHVVRRGRPRGVRCTPMRGCRQEGGIDPACPKGIDTRSRKSASPEVVPRAGSALVVTVRLHHRGPRATAHLGGGFRNRRKRLRLPNLPHRSGSQVCLPAGLALWIAPIRGRMRWPQSPSRICPSPRGAAR